MLKFGMNKCQNLLFQAFFSEFDYVDSSLIYVVIFCLFLKKSYCISPSEKKHQPWKNVAPRVIKLQLPDWLHLKNFEQTVKMCPIWLSQHFSFRSKTFLKLMLYFRWWLFISKIVSGQGWPSVHMHKSFCLAPRSLISMTSVSVYVWD